MVYSEDDGQVVYETFDLNKAQWLPCSKRTRKFVPLQTEPLVSKLKRKPSLKVVNSVEHSVKGYADDVVPRLNTKGKKRSGHARLFDAHVTVLQSVGQRAGDLDLCFKPVKYASYLFDGSKCLQKGIPLFKGDTSV